MSDSQFIEFSQEGPFYGLVGAFMIGMAASPAIRKSSNPLGLTEHDYIVIEGRIVESKHFFPFAVFEQVQSKKLNFDVFVGTSCMMLTNTAYETVKTFNDHSPEFEFFRHLRNASSHGNVLTFSSIEPKRPAFWRGHGIDHRMKGNTNPLNGKACFGPLFGPADLLELLADIEKKLICPWEPAGSTRR